MSTEVVQRCLDLWNSQAEMTDARLSEFMHPDFVLDLRANVLNPGVFEGYDEFRRFVGEVGEAWAEFRMEPQEFFEAGEHIVVFAQARATGRGSGVQLDSPVAAVCVVREDKLASLRIEPDRAEALRSVGLPARDEA